MLIRIKNRLTKYTTESIMSIDKEVFMIRDRLGRFIKGQRSSIGTEFKKGEHLGKDHPQWKGGRRSTVNGYIMVNRPEHPRAYRYEVYEHIIVAEEKLGRYLLKGECVHHLNGVKGDNRPENIVVFPSNGEHIIAHSKYKRYSKQNLPIPKNLGERIKVIEHNKIFEVYKCVRCKKLFWAFCRFTKTQKHCSHSCAKSKGLICL